MSDSDISEIRGNSDGGSGSPSPDRRPTAPSRRRPWDRRTRINRISTDGMAILETSSSDEFSPPRLRRRRLSATRPLLIISTSSSSSDEGSPQRVQRTRVSTTDADKATLPIGSASCSRVISDSESGEDYTDKCPICLRGFRNQQLGSPEGCDHAFCFTCLQKWAETCNKCPMDRRPFSIILVRDNIDGPVVLKKEVASCNTLAVNFLDHIYCMICLDRRREDRMLLCDFCDCGFHMDCLDPPMLEVPSGSWFCPNCIRSGRDQGPPHQPHPSRREGGIIQALSSLNDPALPATRGRRQYRPVTTFITVHSPNIGAMTETVLVQRSSGTTEETIVRRTRYKTGRRKKKKTRSKRKQKRAVPKQSTSRPTRASTTVTKAVRRQRTGMNLTFAGSSSSRRFTTIPVLHIFPPRNELNPVSDTSDVDDAGGELALLRQRGVNLSTRSLQRAKAIEIFNSTPPPRPAPAPCEARADLLLSILESQAIWHSKPINGIIKSDGNIELPGINNSVDVRNAGVERTSTAAPVFPDTESRNKPEKYNVSETSSASSASNEPTPSSSSMGSAPSSDRGGYRNFLNTVPLGPTPICRTGPPLRFRMPIRPQLRRIPLMPRKPPKSPDGDDEKKKDGQKHSEDECGLYSDVELNTEKDEDNTDGEVNRSVAEESNKESDAYDPADPCDSDDELKKITPPMGSPLKPTPDDECPVFSLYSSDSVAFSHKNEEERANLTGWMTQQDAGPIGSCPGNSEENKHPVADQAREVVRSAPVFPKRRRLSSSSESSSPGTPRRIRNLPKEKKASPSFRSYRKRESSLSSEHDRLSPGPKKAVEKVTEERGRMSTGLEGLDVEAVSSGNDLDDDRLSSLSLSSRSRHSSPLVTKKGRRRKSIRSARCASEEGEIDSDRDKRRKISEKNKSDFSKKPRRNSKSVSPSRLVMCVKSELAWKKPSRGEKKFRNSRKSEKEKDRRRRESDSPSPKRDKRKSREKKKLDKKKEIERYDVRKVVKVKEVDRKDSFGRDVKSRSVSGNSARSRSWSRNRSIIGNRRSRSRSHSPSRRARRRGRHDSASASPRVNRKRHKSQEKIARKERRSRSKKRSASPKAIGRMDKKAKRSRSRSSVSSSGRSPKRSKKRRTVTPARRRRSTSWSQGPSTSREEPMQNLTVVIKPKDRKKRKSAKIDKKKTDMRKKKTGNSKEVFASGDNVLVSVNFSKSSKSSGCLPVIPLLSPARLVTKRRKRSAEEIDKGPKAGSTVSKTVIDAALSAQPPKRKKVSRLNDEEAEKILNQKPVAVIDLNESPYREQTPSPINVVVVSDSGSGDEAKAPAPLAPRKEDIIVIASSPPVPSAVASASGPKTPPEPPVKFLIAKPSTIRPIANPLAEQEEQDEEEQASQEKAPVVENLKDKPPEPVVEPQHKGPNTPLSTPPRGPSTPKSPPSPQSSPDAYDPFKPTQSPTLNAVPDHLVKEAPTVAEQVVEKSPVPLVIDEPSKPEEPNDVASEDVEIVDLTENVPPVATAEAAEIVEVIVQQPKKTTPQPVAPINALPLFTMPSPNKTPNRTQSVLTAAVATAAVSGIQRLQHRLGSPVSKPANSVKLTPEKRPPPEQPASTNVKMPNTNKRNGPLQDTTNEPVDMDDSPYSPATSEGDDLFEPPPTVQYKTNKTPTKPTNKFDLLFGTGGQSPIRNGAKKPHKANKQPKPAALKHTKKTPTKKNVPARMDEDQLRILDEVPSSAVELQVKDKFLKKLNRQERVVDEVKTVLKPYYAAKRISKEDYKDILRRAVPKICHSKSGEINPSKIKHLVEAYVRKCSQKKKTTGGMLKFKMKKTTMFS